MADHTHIEWTDATWNIITGCSVVSAGCKHCYAMKLAGTRLKHDPSRAGLTIDTKAGPVWNGEVRFNEQWLDQPLRWRRARRIFVCAHGDLFHENVPDEWIDRVFAVMATAPQHTFQVLTKRPERMRRYLADPALLDRLDRTEWPSPPGPAGRKLFRQHHGVEGWPLPNVWLGVSVEDQAAADERIPLLLQCPAAVRWISAEPLLGQVDLANVRWASDAPIKVNVLRPAIVPDLLTGWMRPGIKWVVAGGESGAGARPMHPDWARSLRDQCAAAGAAFLFKQWGDWAPSGQFAPVPVGAADRFDVAAFYPGGTSCLRLGKRRAGRHLDGVLHDGYPEVRHA